MKIKIMAILAAALFVACGSKNGSEANINEQIVGGHCSYNEFAGTCTATGVDESGDSIFTFVGKINGDSVELEGNVASEKMAEGKSVSCNLMFIKTGTCTPCMFSIGQCGRQAWDAFASSEKE